MSSGGETAAINNLRHMITTEKGGGLLTPVQVEEGDVSGIVTDTWSLIKCTLPVGDEFISLKLEGVWLAGEGAFVSDDLLAICWNPWGRVFLKTRPPMLKRVST